MNTHNTEWWHCVWDQRSLLPCSYMLFPISYVWWDILGCVHFSQRKISSQDVIFIKYMARLQIYNLSFLTIYRFVSRKSWFLKCYIAVENNWVSRDLLELLEMWWCFFLRVIGMCLQAPGKHTCSRSLIIHLQQGGKNLVFVCAFSTSWFWKQWPLLFWSLFPFSCIVFVYKIDTGYSLVL